MAWHSLLRPLGALILVAAVALMLTVVNVAPDADGALEPLAADGDTILLEGDSGLPPAVQPGIAGRDSAPAPPAQKPASAASDDPSGSPTVSAAGLRGTGPPAEVAARPPLAAGAPRSKLTGLLPLDEVRAGLSKYDTLFASEGDDGIVFCIALTENPNGGSHYDLSDNNTEGAWWAKKINKINREHNRRHRHPVILRYAPVRWEPWHQEVCDNKTEKGHKAMCVREINRQVSAWEKIKMIRDVLSLPGVTHVMTLDGDAVMNHMKRDTLTEMAQLLEDSTTADRVREILIVNEDYRGGDGPGGIGTGINTGMLFVKNSNYTRTFFTDLMQAGFLGPAYEGPGKKCTDNEQACMEAWQTWKKRRKDSEYPGFNKRLMKVSSLRYGMNPCIWFDCTLEKFPNIPEYDYKESRHHACHHCRPEFVGCHPRCDLNVNSTDINIVHFMGDSRFYIDYVLPMLPQD